MQDENDTIKKVCFREAETDQAKAVFGTVTDQGDFIKVKTTKGSTFTINKRYVVFIKDGGYE